MPGDDTHSDFGAEIVAARVTIARMRDALAKIRSRIDREPTWRSKGEAMARDLMANAERMRTLFSKSPGDVEVHELETECCDLIDEARELIDRNALAPKKKWLRAAAFLITLHIGLMLRRGIARAISPYPIKYLIAVLASLVLTKHGRDRFSKWINGNFGDEYLRKHPWFRKPRQ